MDQSPLLDRIFWHTLTGPHAQYASGTGDARRYARGFSPILAFADAARPDFAALAPYCAADERFYCEGWSGASPDGWRIEAESTMYRMIWKAKAPENDGAPTAIALGLEHANQAVQLAALCRPGPFGPRTIELGEYFGYVEDGHLVAMAGERMHVAGLREISGVCVHPDYQGRGLARQLMAKLVHRQMGRGETPFLHVMRANDAAHQLYLRMGFADYVESVVRVVALGR
jgi:ribosomal protein S18 acetylase RimI-like enzyme